MIDLIVGWPGQDAIYLFKHLRKLGREVNLLSKTHFLAYDNTSVPYIDELPLEKIFSYSYSSIYFLQAFHSPTYSRLNSLSYWNSININTLTIASFLDYLSHNNEVMPKDIILASSRLCLRTEIEPTLVYCRPIEFSPYTASKIASEVLLSSFCEIFKCRLVMPTYLIMKVLMKKIFLISEDV